MARRTPPRRPSHRLGNITFARIQATARSPGLPGAGGAPALPGVRPARCVRLARAIGRSFDTARGCGLRTCSGRRRPFSMTSGMALHGTKRPLGRWLGTIWWIAAPSDGISGRKPSAMRGITRKAARDLGHRIRSAVAGGTIVPGSAGGIVEFDKRSSGAPRPGHETSCLGRCSPVEPGHHPDHPQPAGCAGVGATRPASLALRLAGPIVRLGGETLFAGPPGLSALRESLGARTSCAPLRLRATEAERRPCGTRGKSRMARLGRLAQEYRRGRLRERPALLPTRPGAANPSLPANHLRSTMRQHDAPLPHEPATVQP